MNHRHGYGRTPGLSFQAIPERRGADSLFGDAGNDTIRGGEGNDTFVFTARSDKGYGRDRRLRSRRIHRPLAVAFKGIGPKGVPADDRFHVGSQSETKKQKIVYDDESGWLVYARTGSHTADPVKFAKIGKHRDLDHADFLVI